MKIQLKLEPLCKFKRWVSKKRTDVYQHLPAATLGLEANNGIYKKKKKSVLIVTSLALVFKNINLKYILSREYTQSMENRNV